MFVFTFSCSPCFWRNMVFQRKTFYGYSANNAILFSSFHLQPQSTGAIAQGIHNLDYNVPAVVHSRSSRMSEDTIKLESLSEDVVNNVSIFSFSLNIIESYVRKTVNMDIIPHGFQINEYGVFRRILRALYRQTSLC